MTLPPSVQVTEPTPGFPVFEVNHSTCQARIASHGAQVMEWQPSVAPAPVLYLSPKAIFREGTAIRGGIPICWPWFSTAPEGVEGPSHGVARTQFWELVEASEDQAGVTLVFSLKHEDLEAVATLTLGERLTVSVETRNVGNEPRKLSGALHSYLKIDEITRISVGGLAGCPYLDTVGSPTRMEQEGPLDFGGEVDRIYDSTRPLRLDDPGMDRVLMVEKSGSPSTVVWNPWTGKAASLVDLPNDGFMDFVCLEAAIANEVAIEIDPGKSHVLATTISVEC